jgi:CHAT domain-containing protein/Tfp pilus assembly protein PilF
VYSFLDEKQTALEYYEKALPTGRSVGDRYNKAKTLNNIGTVYFTLGAKQKALRYYKKALAISRKIGSRSVEASSLNNIGLVYFRLGKSKKRKALKYYKKALPIYRAVGNRSGETAALNNLGNLYSVLGENQKALEYYGKALRISRTIGDRYREVATLSNIGAVYLNLGKKQKTLEYLEKSLPIWRAIGNRSGEARTLHNLMIFWEGLKKIQLSVFYGKQCVNLYQELRTNISGLDKKIQSSYLESKKNTYRKLADLLIKEGLLSEAQQVLDMLKQEEYFEFIRRDASSARTLSAQVDFTNFEKQWLAKYNTVMGNISNIGKEYHILKTKKTKNEEEKKHMEELGLKLTEANKAFRQYFTKMKEAFEKYEKDKKTGRHETLTLAKKAGSLQSALKYLDETEGGKSAALHYNVYGGRVTVILTTPYSQLAKSSEIDQKILNRMIMRYRMAVQGLGKEPQRVVIKKISGTAAHKNLYDVIFKPVDGELKKYGATNLMIYLDGVLRYLPLPALWDGKSYLVQRYRMTIFTTSSLTNIKDKPEEERIILGLGASAGGKDFAPLPNVKEEIRRIVNDKEKGFNGLINGKAFIDNDFTKNTFVSQLKTEDYPLVHISSHFKFSPGDETMNYLLMGDGSVMNLAEIRDKGNIFHKVELLMLAACETGVGGGNGQEIDGFGELAQEKGAKSIVATLWKVTDQSTKELMVKFYRILKEGNVTSKIEALRLAQLELAGLEDLLDKNNSMVKRKKSKYSHPYYWGPFIMIGNWR